MLNFEIMEEIIVDWGPNSPSKEEIKNKLKKRAFSSIPSLQQLLIENKSRIKNLNSEYNIIWEIIEEKREEIKGALKN